MFQNDIGEPDLDQQDDIFVGRVKEREEIKQFIRKKRFRLFYVTGAPGVGKERLIHKVCDELLWECKDKPISIECVKLNCKYLKTWTEFQEHLLMVLKSKQEVKIETILSGNIHNLLHFFAREKTCVLFSFSKTDELIFSKDGCIFKRFCLEILQTHQNIFILLSSQVRLYDWISFPMRHVHLNKLDEIYGAILLHKAAPDIEFGESAKKIVQGCCHLPGLIVEAAQVLVTHQDIISPESIKDLLKNPKNVLQFFSSTTRPEEEQLEVKIKTLLSRVPKKLVSTANDLRLLQGSFSTSAIQAVLGHQNENEANMHIIPLRDASIIEFDKESHLFSFNPLFKACLDENPSASGSELARLRFVKFFVETMVTVDRKLYKDSHKNIVDYFHYDYENVCSVMKQAMHCTDGIFEALMKAVCEAEEIFIKCFEVEQVKDFYHHLLSAANQFGKPEEIAVLKMYLAQAMSQMKVDDHREEVSKLFLDAFKLLSWKDPGYHHMTLMGFLGRFFVRQGSYQKGLRLIKSALNMKVGNTNNTRYYRRTLEFLVQRALAEVFREDYAKAEETLNEALDIAQKQAPYHSAVAVIFNTFGLINDRSGRDGDRALQWYKSSLDERRKYSSIAPEILVVPLNNIAWQSMKRGNLGNALKLLNEALEIRKKCGWNDYYTSLTLKQKADVFFIQGKIKDAIETCDEAYKICQECTPKHSFLIDIRFLRFHCHLISKDMKNANEDLLKMLASRERYITDTERGEVIMKILFHGLILGRDEDGWDNAYNELQTEIRRLRDLALKREDFDRYVQLCKIMNEVSLLFTSRRFDNSNKHYENCVHLVIENCKICSLLPDPLSALIQ